MLEASRKELNEQVPKALRNSTKYRRGIYFFIEDYIIEPIATGLRFLHLVIIFVPVIVTIPAIWLGQRQPKRDNERSGTLWWYGFLVSSMERAGAAFIKVYRRRAAETRRG
jgi:aarF domain-containing kinase